MENAIAHTTANDIDIAAGRTFSPLASYDLTTAEGQMKAFNAGVACDKKLSEMEGQQIVMTEWYVEPIEAADMLTGEVKTRPHIVITDADGVTYEAQSVGLYQALSRLHTIRPVIDADNPAIIEVISRKVRLGKMLTFKLIG